MIGKRRLSFDIVTISDVTQKDSFKAFELQYK